MPVAKPPLLLRVAATVVSCSADPIVPVLRIVPLHVLMLHFVNENSDD